VFPDDRTTLGRRRLAAGTLAAMLLLGAFVGLAAALPGPVRATGAVHVAAAAAPTGTITGPSSVGPTSRATYHVSASGGPAEAANGTIVGTYSYTTSIVGANTSGGAVTPPQGVLVNGSTNLTLLSPNATEPITLYVDITSSYQGTNTSTNLSYAISILQPILLVAGLKVVGPTGIKAFALDIDLDGAHVGSVSVPSLTSGQNYPISFSYLGQGLGPGWHTFTVSLAAEHGLVVFQNGQESYSSSFYISGPAPNDSLWILAGVAFFAVAVFIWVTNLARRRPKTKS